MSVTYRDKPVDRLREEVIDQLIMNYGHGEISLEAFERRLDEADQSQDHEVLHALRADLPLEVNRQYTDRKKQELNFDYSPVEPDDVGWMVNIMGGSDRTGAWTVPRELRIVTIMGGADLDFSEARFAHPELRIRVFCLMGGVDIKVPEQIGVDSSAIAVMGGVDNKANSNASNDWPRIVVEGLVIMGGLDIKVKRMRETWRKFANDLRSFFGFAPATERKATEI